MVASLIAFAISLAPVFVTDGPPRLLGLTERILLAVNSVWLCVIAFALLRRSKGYFGRIKQSDA